MCTTSICMESLLCNWKKTHKEADFHMHQCSGRTGTLVFHAATWQLFKKGGEIPTNHPKLGEPWHLFTFIKCVVKQGSTAPNYCTMYGKRVVTHNSSKTKHIYLYRIFVNPAFQSSCANALKGSNDQGVRANNSVKATFFWSESRNTAIHSRVSVKRCLSR